MFIALYVTHVNVYIDSEKMLADFCWTNYFLFLSIQSKSHQSTGDRSCCIQCVGW